MHTEGRRSLFAAAGLMGLLATTVWAGDQPAGVAGAGDDAVDQSLLSSDLAALGDLAALEGVAPLSAEKLDASTAKAQIQVDKIQVNENDLNGVVSDNVAIGNTTGNNTVSDGAFSSSTGFMTTIQNTGNNVLIQNATIINVSVEP